MKTVLTALVALAIAAPVSASVYNLGDAALSTAQQAQVKALLESDESSNTIQRRIDVIVGNTQTFGSEATADAAELKFFLSSDDSSNDIQRRIEATVK